MDIKIFKEIGISEIEASVYLALLENGPSHTGLIIKKTGLHKATVYQTLERLLEKGLVGYIIEENIKTFHAVDPKVILDQLKEKEDNFRKILPELKQKLESSKKPIFAEIFRGKKGIITVYRDILSHNEYLNLGAGIPIVEVLGPFYHQIQKTKKKRKIKAKLLISEKHKGTNLVKGLIGEFKYLPKEFEGPINTVIYGDKVAIIVWSDLMAFVLESKEANNAYRKYFNVLWRMAKK